MSLNRLQKITYESDLTSRRKADLIIKQGRVKLNGRLALIGEKADPISEHILVDGKDLSKKLSHKVLLLNKPYGAISNCHDNHGRKTIKSLIPPHLRYGIHNVGRLDYDSRGAILLTNNGDLTLRFIHPKYSHSETYLVWVNGQPSLSILDNWRIEILNKVNSKTLLKVILKERHNRKIRRIANLIGHTVLDLQRISISNINLNGLEEGKWREIEAKEWNSFIN